MSKGALCGITVELITLVQTEGYQRSIAEYSGLICNMTSPEAPLRSLPHQPTETAESANILTHNKHIEVLLFTHVNFCEVNE
jgi:hypothetical protein